MSATQILSAPDEHEVSPPIRRHWWRFPALCLLLLLSLAITIFEARTAPAPEAPLSSFIVTYMLGFGPYLAACVLVFATAAPQGRSRWLELGLILGGALIMQAILLPLFPDLTRDSWRYLWDARVTLHGYSPYTHVPLAPELSSLHNFVLENSRFRGSPTIYPPGAQAIYVLSYLIAPDNIFVLKGIFALFAVATSAALALLLLRKGLDPARCIVYAWCPLTIIEFALQGHVDAATILFTVLALLCASGQWRGSRVLTGLMLALATLTKLYPLLLLVVVLRRRDWALLVTCFTTIFIFYIPYLMLGNGQVLGFFATYASQQGGNEGIVPLAVGRLIKLLHLASSSSLIVIYGVDLLTVGIASGVVFWLHQRERLSMEAGILILTSTIFAVSSHIFPWYTTALLPMIALLAVPVWTRRQGWSGQGLAVVMAWYLPFISLISYVSGGPNFWDIYYAVAYYFILAGLVIAAALQLWRLKNTPRSNVS